MWILLWIVFWAFFEFPNFWVDADPQDPNSWNVFFITFWASIVFQIFRSAKRKK